MEGVVKIALLKKKANLINKEKGGHALQFQHLILGVKEIWAGLGAWL